MAILQSNVRRLRRKVCSRRLLPLTATCALILLYLCIQHYPHVPAIVIDQPQFTTSTDDPTINWTKFAYVQHVTSSEDLCKAVMLFSELKEAYSIALRVLLYPSNWSIAGGNNTDSKKNPNHIARLLRYAADEFSVILQPTDILRVDNLDDMRWREPFAKFLAYNLTQYERVITLGWDSTVLHSLDELFFLPTTPLAMPYVYWGYNKGWHLSDQLMVIRPNATDFKNLEGVVRNSAVNEKDMDIIEKVYGDTVVKLPQRPYHILTQEFQYKPWEHTKYLGSSRELWNPRAILRDTRLVHFFEPPMPKIWTASNATWQSKIPQCRPDRYRRLECTTRNAWHMFYNDYMNRRNNICGKGFIPENREQRLRA